MDTRRIGDVEVSAIGLGGMPMSIEGRPDEARSLATIHAALDAGVTLIDTADAYHLHADEVGHNETLIAKALASHDRGADVLVATKGGHLRPGDGSWTLNGSSAYLKEACEASLRRLGVEAIGLYQFHRPDPRIPYAESVGAVRELLDEGKIRLAGISNADPEQIRLANEILDGRLVSVQNQFSPAFRSSEPELDLCDELGIAFLPWSPSAASPAPVNSAPPTPRSPASPRSTASARSVSACPGCSPSPRSSYRSRAPAAPRRSATRPPHRTRSLRRGDRGAGRRLRRP